MSQSCPLCNALKELKEICPVCFSKMLDAGCLSDYLGPYSPYKTEDFFTDSPELSRNYCVHLIYCPICNYDTHLVEEMETI